MALIEMHEDLLVGHYAIDEQHRELIDRINELQEAILSKKAVREVEAIFNFLGNYVIAHFGMEEKMMIKRDYPDYDSHKALHTHFVMEYAKIGQSFTENAKNSSNDSWSDAKLMETLLRDWLVTHIMTVDKKLSGYLSS